MKLKLFPFLPALPVAAALLFAAQPPLRAAQTDDPSDAATMAAAKEMDDAALKQGDAKVIARLSEEFTTLAGSQDNATALVTGLRDGSSVTLATIIDGSSQTTTFKPATGKLGYGNVFLALALAQSELTKAGITNPTTSQLSAALNGGSVTVGPNTTDLAGVLKLRADGQGWGQIAKSLDVRLGTIVSGLRSAREHVEGPEKAERAEKAEKADRPEKANVPGRPDLPDRAATPARPEVPERAARPDVPGRAGR